MAKNRIIFYYFNIFILRIFKHVTMAKKHDLENNFSLPSQYADFLGHNTISKRNIERRKKQGQFFTTIDVAEYMANFSEKQEERLKILDCGSGAAILSCSLIEKIILKNYNIKTIELVAYEKDRTLANNCNKVLEYLEKWVNKRNAQLEYKVINDDFILSTSNNFFATHSQGFHIVISNPPYFKLNKANHIVRGFESIINGQPNIYMLFLARAAELLADGGELIFIIPRSFTSGSYFRLFRKYFFSIIQLTDIHVFDSRRSVFERDNVLQENIIIRGIRRNLNGFNPEITIYSSSGTVDLKNRNQLRTNLKKIINYNTIQQILQLPLSKEDVEVLNIINKFKGSLAKYNIKVSTGPVVPFRKRLNLVSDNYKYSKVPLIWLHNISKMKIDLSLTKPGKKNFIKSGEKSLPVLIPNRNYVFIRRFSSKDENSRLVAVPFLQKDFQYDYIGVENHINYIYKEKAGLKEEDVAGISLILNSTLYDKYFRIINGNTNVSATELRELPLPELNTIKILGEEYLKRQSISENRVIQLLTGEHGV
jgi:adenine-specific DNA-methyltransferase